MDNEIGTYSMILSKTLFGKSGSECPTKTTILAMHELIAVDNASTYGSSECVRIRDVRRKTVEWNYYLSVSPTSMSFGATGGTKSFTISSYKKRVVDGVEESSTTSVSTSNSITGSQFSLSGNSVRAAVNQYSSSQSGRVTVTQSESGKTATISLSQDGDSISSYGDWVVTVSANPTSIPNSGGTSTITATATRTVYWESGDVTTESATPTLSTNLGTISGTTLTLGENTSTSSRTATITASHGGASDTCTVTLAAAESTLTYDFVVTDWNKSVAAAGGTTDAIAIRSTKTENGSTTNIGWSIDSSTVPSWLTWNASSMTFTATANTSTSSREYRIYFEQNESGNRDYAMVTLAGASTSDNYVFTWSDGTTAQKSLTPGSAATTGSYDLVSTKNGSAHLWDVSSNVSWITTDKASSTRLSYSVTANTGNSRTGIITASQSESGKTLIIQIVQASGSVTPDTYEFLIKKSTDTDYKTEITWDNVPANTAGWVGNIDFYSRKNGQKFSDFSGSSNVSWIVITDTVDKIKYNVQHNTSTSARSGIVTFTLSESNKKCYMYIKQLGVPATPKIKFLLFNDTTNALLYSTEWDIPTSSTVKELEIPFPDSINENTELKASLEGDLSTGTWTGNHLIGSASKFMNRLNTSEIESNRVSNLTFTLNWWFKDLRYVLEFNDGTTEKKVNVVSGANTELFGVRSTEFGVRSPIIPDTDNLSMFAVSHMNEDSTGKGYNITLNISENPNSTSRTGTTYLTQTASGKEIKYTVTQAGKPLTNVWITVNNPLRLNVYPFSDILDVEALAPGEFRPAVDWGSDGTIKHFYTTSEGIDVCGDVSGRQDKAIVGNAVEFYTTEPFSLESSYIRLTRIGSMTLTGVDQTVSVG